MPPSKRPVPEDGHTLPIEIIEAIISAALATQTIKGIHGFLVSRWMYDRMAPRFYQTISISGRGKKDLGVGAFKSLCRLVLSERRTREFWTCVRPLSLELPIDFINQESLYQLLHAFPKLDNLSCGSLGSKHQMALAVLAILLESPVSSLSFDINVGSAARYFGTPTDDHRAFATVTHLTLVYPDADILPTSFLNEFVALTHLATGHPGGLAQPGDFLDISQSISLLIWVVFCPTDEVEVWEAIHEDEPAIVVLPSPEEVVPSGNILYEGESFWKHAERIKNERVADSSLVEQTRALVL
ncbi:hypothetical protein DL96DRAFT_1685301 [Flagelloscypha sp. PMI_526]|nr:hypothetical protein DL96DRAFT_1685301 [Flagelloscypha sp. PMI_526]